MTMKTLEDIQEQLLDDYKRSKAPADSILFLGDSLVEFLPTNKLALTAPLVNHGIRGIDTRFLLEHLATLTTNQVPKSIVLLIGTNDLRLGESVDDLVERISRILELLRQKFPRAELYLESLYPRRQSESYGVALADEIAEANLYLRTLEAHYIDVYSRLVGEAGLLKPDYTKDGVHLNYSGYKVVMALLEEVLG